MILRVHAIQLGKRRFRRLAAAQIREMMGIQRIHDRMETISAFRMIGSGVVLKENRMIIKLDGHVSAKG